MDHMNVSRPGKLTHCQTILYEIDMLTHSAQRLQEETWKRDMDQWVCLEAFLVHFRNLIEFFGKEPEGDTLSIKKPKVFWPGISELQEKKLEQFYRPDLWKKYEPSGEKDKISRYLHHCTEERVHSKTWNTRLMYQEISALTEPFETLLPKRERAWAKPEITIGTVLGATSNSTASGSPPSLLMHPKWNVPKD